MKKTQRVAILFLFPARHALGPVSRDERVLRYVAVFFIKLKAASCLQPSTFSPPSKTSTKMSLTLSPFHSAPPLPRHLFFEYDEDGDAIMIDADTGERLNGESIETLVESPIPFIASPVAAVSPPVAALCPPAPARPPRFSLNPEDEDDVAVRSLAEEMAEIVLDVEALPAAAAGIPPLGGEPVAVEDWCVSVTVSDLALRLDMRHPRVLLNLLRFVSTYNELAPPGEDIHLPLIPQERADFILSHESVVNPVPEFADQVAELRFLVERYTQPEPFYDNSTDSEEHRDY